MSDEAALLRRMVRRRGEGLDTGQDEVNAAQNFPLIYKMQLLPRRSVAIIKEVEYFFIKK